MTRAYAEVIGDPIAHSKSPLIHEFWLAKRGIEADYRACHVRPDELATYFDNRRADPDWRGCNVTIPHKQSALNFVDEVHLHLLDATNVVAPRGGKLVAWNTDVAGILEPLAEMPIPPGFATKGDQVAIAHVIGAGGAAQAALRAVGEAGYLQIEIYNRTLARAQDTAAKAGQSRSSAFGLEHLKHATLRPDDPFGGYDRHYLVINASPMGMAGQDAVPIDLSAYPDPTIVFDMVYAPLDTPLLIEARACGLRTIDGLQMLVGQAAAAFELFFGEPAPRQHDAELRALLTS